MEFAYQVSTKCDNPSYCVEVATNVPGVVSLKDSSGDTVKYSTEEWRAFLDGVKANEFDV
ncbi:DUF397 domain-containing protein [Actinomadura gamaensis]|uniref:DUF397 domain-containing protein n=1 Tax=Actinomadura gamaensis TaxID=1763541 RepID=A0ABV9TQE3_9ACTN